MAAGGLYSSSDEWRISQARSCLFWMPSIDTAPALGLESMERVGGDGTHWRKGEQTSRDFGSALKEKLGQETRTLG